MRKSTAMLILAFFLSSVTYAQVGDRFEKLSESNMKSYAQPFATALGTALNSGGYHSASIADLFGFSISFRAMYIMVPDDQTTFTPSVPAGYTASQTATIFGKDGKAFAGPNGYIVYPPGIDITSVPFAIPQVAGSFMGTELMLRYFPKISIGETDLNFFGFGVRHSVSRYIPLVPVDIAVQFLYNSLTVTDLIDLSNIAFNAHASKSFGLFTLYGGLQYESTTFDVTYDIKGDPSSGDPGLQQDKQVKVSIDGDNNFRFTLGGALTLAVVVLNVDFSLGSQSVISSGLSFEF